MEELLKKVNKTQSLTTMVTAYVYLSRVSD